MTPGDRQIGRRRLRDADFSTRQPLGRTENNSHSIIIQVFIRGDIPDAIGVDVTIDDFPPSDIDRTVAVQMEIICAIGKIQDLVVLELHVEKTIDTLRIGMSYTSHK